MSPFRDRVIAIIRTVPFGKVASYGQIALYAGLPRAARQVGWILNQSEGKSDLPWWRIINHKGRISIKGTYFNTKELQRKLLRAEHIIVSDDFMIDMEKYRFMASEKSLRSFQLSSEYIQKIIEKYGIG